MRARHLYEDKSNCIERELTILLARVTHHVHPDVVHKVVEANKIFKQKFLNFCPYINLVEQFFYSGSDCIFHGVRRPINSQKVDNWKNRIYSADGTILDDNIYPRHIWCFLSGGTAYSGGKKGTYKALGLSPFELAHIFAHKDDERELQCKLFQNVDNEIKPYALFTSASNTVLIPNGMTKPTDKFESIKIAFFKRHIELFGESTLPGLKNFDESKLPTWYHDIHWEPPTITVGWEKNVDKLLNFRDKHLFAKYKV